MLLNNEIKRNTSLCVCVCVNSVLSPNICDLKFSETFLGFIVIG